jgi:transcriptional regulator with XRE-family HTH domain
MKKAFAERLRLVRDSFGVSQLRLANALGAQQSYVAKWEAEAYDPSEEVKGRIAQFLQVSPAWLVDGAAVFFINQLFSSQTEVV